MSEDTKGIYKMNWDCGRMGSIEGIFITTRKKAKNIIGENIYFGEVLGKHSEVYGEMDESDMILITEDKNAVEVFEEYDLSIGYNPFNFIQMEE